MITTAGDDERVASLRRGLRRRLMDSKSNKAGQINHMVSDDGSQIWSTTVTKFVAKHMATTARQARRQNFHRPSSGGGTQEAVLLEMSDPQLALVFRTVDESER